MIYVPPLPKRSGDLKYPEINWHKTAEIEIRLRELEIRRIEALARLEEARANRQASETRRVTVSEQPSWMGIAIGIGRSMDKVAEAFRGMGRQMVGHVRSVNELNQELDRAHRHQQRQLRADVMRQCAGMRRRQSR